MRGSSLFYRVFVRPVLFLLPPETAHRLGMAALRWATPVLQRWGTWARAADPRGEVVIKAGSRTLRFANPVGLAAGLDKDAEALTAWAALGFGFVEVGTVTPRPQPGNPTPRLFRFVQSRAIVNRMGFNNAGADAMARRLSRCPPLGIPLGINIGKNKDTPADRAVEDYIYCLERLYKYADFFVVNISSPNTPGLRALQSADSLEPLLKAIKKRASVLAFENKGDECPLFVKLSPDEEGYEEMVESVVRSGFDGIVATNTTRSREGVPDTAPKEGGLSGAPLRDRSTEVMRTIARAARGRLVLIGVGGIFRAEDALEKVLAGASLVEVYTGFVYNGPGFARSLAKRLARLAARCGYETVQKALGKGL